MASKWAKSTSQKSKSTGIWLVDHRQVRALKTILIFTKHVAILLLNFIPAVTNGMNLFVWKFSTIIIQYFVHNFSFNDKSRVSSNPFLLKWHLTLKTVVFYEFILQLRTPYLHLRLATKAWNSSDSFYFLVFNLCYFNKHHSFKQFFLKTRKLSRDSARNQVWSELCIMVE